MVFVDVSAESFFGNRNQDWSIVAFRLRWLLKNCSKFGLVFAMHGYHFDVAAPVTCIVAASA